MFEESIVELKMKKMLLKGMTLDKNVYICKVESYESQEKKMTIITEQETLCKLQLDAIYQCDIYGEDKNLSCEGFIKERYQSEEGNLLTFYIENGFYEILND
ncbi:MAG: hypothetical protein R3Y58_04400 [Eubacteriales bacterium]